MKKNIKKNLTAAMGVSMGAMSMVGGVAPIFADAGVSGEQLDCGAVATIKATGITEAGVTVKAYQLVDGYYDNGNLVRYVLVDPANGAIANIEKPTAAEMAAIANKIAAGTFADAGVAMTKDAEGNYTADVEPGLYMILVTGSTDTVFNPALVAVNVDDATGVNGDKITATDVSMVDFFKDNGTDAYVKSSKSDFDKKVVDAQGADIGNGDTVAVGDVIHFRLDNMTIPSFSGDYEAPVYKITDVLEGGMFSKINNLKVIVNDQEVAADAGVYTLTLNDNDFVISFAEDYLRDHAADAVRPTVVVTYDSALTAVAGMNYAENYNHAKVEYSNNPSDATSMKEIVKNTYNYTFAINGSIDGEAQGKDNEEFIKIDSVKDEDGNEIPLAGAEFAISKNEDMSDALATSVTDDAGHFSFTGLNEGVYYIKETKAPKGYSLNDTTYKVTISADIDEATGIMTEYSVVTEAKASNATAYTAAGSAVYTHTLADAEVEADGSVTNGDIATNATRVDILNTKIQHLPSTGGAGVAMAFAVSAALAGTTGGLVVSAKKKDRK